MWLEEVLAVSGNHPQSSLPMQILVLCSNTLNTPGKQPRNLFIKDLCPSHTGGSHGQPELRNSEVNSNSAEGKFFRNMQAYEQELARQERQAWAAEVLTLNRTSGKG